MNKPDWLARLEQAVWLPLNPLPNDCVIVQREDIRHALDAIAELPPADEPPDVGRV